MHTHVFTVINSHVSPLVA